MPRNSHQDALSDREYDRLLDACERLAEPFDRECRFVVILAGRLGMRAGEISHLDESWIDWDRYRIHIPAYHECEKGKDGGICGYCKSQSKQIAERRGLELETVLKRRWEPKTDHAVRSVPFGFDEEIVDVVRDWFWDHRGWHKSRAAVNRRVTRAADEAGLSVYPHALRATAATKLAYRGVPAPALQSMMGWAQLSVAQKYLRLSGEATAEALQQAYSD